VRFTILSALGAAMIATQSLGSCMAGSSPESQATDTLGLAETSSQEYSLDSIRAVRAAIRKRISESDNYLGFGLGETDSVLRRWRDRTVRMLTVHIGDNRQLGNVQGLERSARNAFSRWQRVGAIPVNFRIIPDSSLAEVHVHWIRSFPMNRSGKAEVYWDNEGWIRKATLTLATHDLHGRPTRPDYLYTVALHEIGHLLGLVHSDDPNDLMYPVTTVNDLTARDRRSARLLYALPPGPVKDP